MTRLTRWLIGLVIINAVLAIVLALWADQVQRTAAAVPAWMVFLQDISRITHFAEDSGLGLAAEVYYAVALPVLPMVTVVAYRLIVHADDGGYSTWVQPAEHDHERMACDGQRRDIRGGGVGGAEIAAAFPAPVTEGSVGSGVPAVVLLP